MALLVLALGGGVALGAEADSRFLGTTIPCTPSMTPVPTFCADVVTYAVPEKIDLDGVKFDLDASVLAAQKAVEDAKITGFCVEFFGTKKFQCLKHVWECRNGVVFKLCASICKDASEADIDACTATLGTGFLAQCNSAQAKYFSADAATCDSHHAELFPKGGFGSGLILGLSLVGAIVVCSCCFWCGGRRRRYKEAIGRQLDAQVDDLDGGAGVELGDATVQRQLDQQQRDIAAQQEYIRNLRAQVAEQEQPQEGQQQLGHQACAVASGGIMHMPARRGDLHDRH